MNRLVRYTAIASLVFGAVMLMLLSGYGQSNIAFAESKGVVLAELQSEDRLAADSPSTGLYESTELQGAQAESFRVQAVLGAQKSAVISGGMDGILKELPFKNGDVFKKGDVLAKYDCRFENAKYREAQAQLAVASRKAAAYENLKVNEAVADVEYVSILQEFERAKAIVEQTSARLALCTIKAPFDGRVTDKIANAYEAVRSGRVLMEIGSLEPLQAELLVPSIWLRWLNVGTELEIAVHETGRSYNAKIKRVHGKVDPVTQTAYVVAEVSQYEEELLPGMSGQAIFSSTGKATSNGFLGMKIEGYGEERN